LTHAYLWASFGVLRIEADVGRLDREITPLGHGIAGIDGKIQYRIVELSCVYLGLPQSPTKHGFDSHGFTQRSPDKDGHLANALIHVNGLGLKRLLPGECKQALG
jgi:hypothetical protein